MQCFCCFGWSWFKVSFVVAVLFWVVVVLGEFRCCSVFVVLGGRGAR